MTTEQAAFVACLCDEVIGSIKVSKREHRLQSPPFALIGGLVVKDGLRGQRYRSAALPNGRTLGVGIGEYPTVRVTSRSTRTDAHRFYLNDGYESVKVSHVFEKKLRNDVNGDLLRAG